MNLAIKLENVTLQYKSKNTVLENINLEFYYGEMVAIVGKSGIGKSTLFNTYVKSLKPLQGTVNINDIDIYKTNKNQWQKIIHHIGFLTQKPNLINTDNVYNNIVRSQTQHKNLFFKFFNILTKQQKINIFKILDSLDMLDKAFFRISELSGGQQQRVEIAKLLTKNVNIILADEPTSNLDYETSQSVLSLLKELTIDKNICTIVNIHDLSQIKQNFSRVIVLNDKKIIYDKPIQEVEIWEIQELIKTK